MSSFAILVTALIGWQIIQYIFAKKAVQELIDESSKALSSDITHILKAHTLSQKAETFGTLHMYITAIDSLFAAIQEVLLCNNQVIQEYMADNMYSLLLQLFESGKDNQGYHVQVGKKALYLTLLHNPLAPDTSAMLSQILEKAVETPADYYQEYQYFLVRKSNEQSTSQSDSTDKH